MYGALWRLMPGHWVVKALIALIVVAAIAYALCFHVYPWVMQTFFPTPEVTVE